MQTPRRRDIPQYARGAARLVAHCNAFDRIAGNPTRAAQARLETALGPEFAGLLVTALSRGRRGRSTLHVAAAEGDDRLA